MLLPHLPKAHFTCTDLTENQQSPSIASHPKRSLHPLIMLSLLTNLSPLALLLWISALHQQTSSRRIGDLCRPRRHPSIVFSAMLHNRTPGCGMFHTTGSDGSLLPHRCRKATRGTHVVSCSPLWHDHAAVHTTSRVRRQPEAHRGSNPILHPTPHPCSSCTILPNCQWRHNWGIG